MDRFHNAQVTGDDEVASDDKALARKEFGGSWVGVIAYWIFRLRQPLLWLFVLVTIALGYSATRLEVQAGFTKMIPLQHEYMKTFVEYQKAFGGANKILVALRSKDGDIYSAEYLDKLKQLHEDLFYLHGVERSSVLSLYSPNAIFVEVVEDGFKMGLVLPNNFDGTPESVAKFRENLLKSTWVGRIVANDFKSALVTAVLQDNDPDTGKRLDVKQVGADLEKIRAKYENDKYSVHIVGFAKSASDIAAGAQGVLLFFALAFVITALLLFWYSGSLKLTFWALIVAMVPVIWLLGVLPLLGLDPRSDVDPGAVPDLLDRRFARRADDQRLEARGAARRRRRDRGALVVHKAVHPRGECAGRQCRRFHRDRLRQDRDGAGARDHRDARRVADDPHQQAAAADPAVVHAAFGARRQEDQGQGEQRQLVVERYFGRRDPPVRCDDAGCRAGAAWRGRVEGEAAPHR